MTTLHLIGTVEEQIILSRAAAHQEAHHTSQMQCNGYRWFRRVRKDSEAATKRLRAG